MHASTSQVLGGSSSTSSWGVQSRQRVRPSVVNLSRCNKRSTNIRGLRGVRARAGADPYSVSGVMTKKKQKRKEDGEGRKAHATLCPRPITLHSLSLSHSIVKLNAKSLFFSSYLSLSLFYTWILGVAPGADSEAINRAYKSK